MSPADVDRLASILLASYGNPSDGPIARGAFAREKSRRDSANLDERMALAEERRKAQEHVATQKEEIEYQNKESRKRDLKAGRIKISSFGDAVLFYDPVQDLLDLMERPLLSPDSGIYSTAVTLDGEEQRGVLRVKVSLASIGRGDVRYAFLRTSKGTINFAPSAMRIGNDIAVVGRYVGNVKYKTVIGEERTAPMLEALYIGSP
jgi:hypothetical protein